MKSLQLTALAASLTVFAGGVSAQALVTEKDKLSYAIGMNFGQSLKSIPDVQKEIDLAVLMRGVTASISASKTSLTEAEAGQILQAFSAKMQQKTQAVAKVEGTKNKTAGDAFLAANKAKAGVKTTASGLQYQVLTPGKGEMPKPNSQVKVHYRGTTIDGKEFDSSYARKEPASFPLNGVIPGWTEGLQLMNKGSKFKFVIPGNLAYAERGSPPNIGPNAVLVFEVELLEIMN